LGELLVVKHQKLETVCNGLHLFNFNKEGQQLMPEYHRAGCSFSAEELAKTLWKSGETKAILVVDVFNQKEVVKILEKFEYPVWKLASNSIDVYKARGDKYVAKKLSVWSPKADLWMVRYILGGKEWGWEEKDRG
jgi:hypothetical protein